MQRATKALVDARVNDLLRILLDGAEGWDLCDYVREQQKEPGTPWQLAEGEKPISYSQIRRYAVKAERLIADSSRPSRKRLLRKHQAQRRHLYALAVEQGDIRAAAAVLKDLADLQGLYPPRKIAPTNPKGDKPYEPLTEAERVAALQALYARVGARGGDTLADGAASADGPLVG